ncbi:hypothetical protein BDN70DRAFT_553758 [Pholiota conissans]|uniref:F-box/LRR-repeat protein n=1 Tax=Pholiota conissans TaxID=109636 RepID=A0A9P5Z4B1_9AGAR|nr:hypothetical protein BDN70DRAFT_553758 [Pholiota conissans]
MFFELFLQAVCLTHCTFQLYDWDALQNEGAHATRPIIHHKCLVSLNIMSSWNRVTEIALSRMEFPELQSLSGTWLRINFIQDLVRRSSCKLKSLGVDPQLNNLDAEVHLVNFLAGIPSLESLFICGCSNPSRRSIDYLFRKLSSTAVNCRGSFPSPVLLPKLKMLTIRHVGWSWPSLLGLLFEHTSNQSITTPASGSSGESEAHPHVRPLHYVDLGSFTETDKFTIEPLVAQKLRSILEETEIKVTIVMNRGLNSVSLDKFLNSHSSRQPA